MPAPQAAGWVAAGADPRKRGGAAPPGAAGKEVAVVRGMDSAIGALPASWLTVAPGEREERSFTSKVVRTGARRHTLHLSGSLHAGWAGRLAAGLAARHVTVVRASARRSSTRWTAEIVFDLLDPDAEASAIDFLALLAEPAPPADGGAPPRLSDARVVRTRRDVLVELRGEDEVGFLGKVLLAFAELGLFPHDMRVETLGSEIRDVFRLQSATGEAPAEGVAAALRARLARLVSAG